MRPLRVSDDEYWDYYRCEEPCTTQECGDDCARNYPEGYAFQHPLSVNAVTRCVEGCGADYFPAPLEGCGEVDAGM